MFRLTTLLRCLSFWRPFWFADDRITRLEARCSPSALEFLRQIKAHPRFMSVLARLETIESTVFRGDVEEALFSLTHADFALRPRQDERERR